MSFEAARAFIIRMKSNEKFAKKVMACQDVEECEVVVQQAGFNFTVTQLKDAGQSMGLSNDELERVVGGIIHNAAPRYIALSSPEPPYPVR